MKSESEIQCFLFCFQKGKFRCDFDTMTHYTEICILTPIGCCSVLNFRAQVSTNQRHHTDLCRATSIRHLSRAPSGGRNDHSKKDVLFLRSYNCDSFKTVLESNGTAKQFGKKNTVEALWADTLIRGQLYLRPP